MTTATPVQPATPIPTSHPSLGRRAVDAIDERLGIRALEYPVPEHAGVGVLVSSLVLVAAVAQAARIRFALSGGLASRNLHAEKFRGGP